MRTKIKNQKYLAAIFLTILITFCGQNLAYAINEAPNFTDGDSTTRGVTENTASGVNIGSTVAATDADNDTLTYTLGGTDAAAFRIVSTSGQLQTNAALDYETKSSYSVTVSASDGNGGSDSISVSITVTDVSEKPVFAPGGVTLTIAENTASGRNIGNPITATDPDSGDTLTYSLRRGDKDAFSIDPNTGQVRTKAALNYERKNAYTDLAVRATDSTGLTGATRLTINVTDVHENRAPSFADGLNTTRTVAENTASGQNIGSAVAATDADNDTLTYSLSGKYAAAFRIVSTTGQLQTKAPLDYETQSSYAVTVSVSDGNNGTDTIIVTINVTDVTDVNENRAPVFTDGSSATRAIAENTASGQNIGAAVAATDADNDTLTYSLGGTDASSFSIVSTTGQLQTSAALDYETKASYSVTVSVSDGNGESDSITVTINVTDVAENNAPVFTDGDSTTRSIAENTAAGENIGTAVPATDTDNDTLTYSLGGTDAAAFSIVSTTGQLRTSTALDYETKSSYAVSVSVSDGNGGSDSITVTITVTDVSEKPVFAPGGVILTIAENAASGTNIGDPITATDPDSGDTLTYSLRRGDAESFSIDANTGQLRTKAPLDYETKNAYTNLAVRATDSTGLTGATRVTINVTDVDENRAPVFADGDSTTRSIAENTAAGENIGTAVAATDVDTGDTLTYTLSGTDVSSFSIVSTSGQLQTSAALDYETKTSYSVTITVSDGSLTDSIIVTITVTDVNENRAPLFTDGDSTTRSIAENTASGENIGTAVAATDADTGDTLTYSLDGTDASSFSIVSTTGQLQTRAALDYETKDTYSVTVSVADGNSESDSITVTINVTDVDENRDPVFADGDSTTRSIAENTASGENIGTAVAATDADNNTLTYTLGGTDAAVFSIVSSSGQLQTSTALDYETKSSYAVSVSVSDGNGGSDSITVTITVTDVSEKPVFAPGGVILTIAENAASGTNIGDPITATDPDSGDTLTYSLRRGDAESFSIDPNTGQVRTKAPLDYETKNAYTDLAVRAMDSTGLIGATRLTIKITDVDENNVQDVDENNAPVFTDGSSTTRSIAENTASGETIGTVTATDTDNDTLTYSLGGTDAASFSIVSTTGQLQTNVALDYETKDTYTMSVSVSDGNGGSDSITVTINVTDVVNENRDPVFTDGDSTTRSIAENTASGVNIGTAVAATDADTDDPLTYTLSGTDASSFSIVSTTGQLQTSTALDYETKDTYTVSVSVSDGNGGSDSITVTINVTDVGEPPVFPRVVSQSPSQRTRYPAQTSAILSLP